MGEVFDDPVMAIAILDRLLRNSQVIRICDDSCRLRAKRKAGALKPSITNQEQAVNS